MREAPAGRGLQGALRERAPTGSGLRSRRRRSRWGDGLHLRRPLAARPVGILRTVGAAGPFPFDRPGGVLRRPLLLSGSRRRCRLSSSRRRRGRTGLRAAGSLGPRALCRRPLAFLGGRTLRTCGCCRRGLSPLGGSLLCRTRRCGRGGTGGRRRRWALGRRAGLAAGALRAVVRTLRAWACATRRTGTAFLGGAGAALILSALSAFAAWTAAALSILPLASRARRAAAPRRLPVRPGPGRAALRAPMGGPRHAPAAASGGGRYSQETGWKAS